MDDFRIAKFLNDVVSERQRQDELRNAGRFTFTLDMPEMAESEKLACIMEEAGEVARNVLARKRLVRDGVVGDFQLYCELVQVAALAGAWCESLDYSEDIPF